MNIYALHCCFSKFSLRNNNTKIMNSFLDLFYNHLDNLTPLTDFKKIIEKNHHAITKLDTHLVRTAQIYIYVFV